MRYAVVEIGKEEFPIQLVYAGYATRMIYDNEVDAIRNAKAVFQHKTFDWRVIPWEDETTKTKGKILPHGIQWLE